jgi:hypothetical protein
MGYKKGSLCLDDLFTASKSGHPSITTAKNGKKYASFIIWENETPDQYGRMGSVQLSQPKDSTASKVYIGNIDAPKAQDATGQVEIVTPTNDLPF